MAYGRGETKTFTAPAINVRGLTYDTCRAVFRAARERLMARATLTARCVLPVPVPPISRRLR